MSDLQDLVRLLRERPEWREELRRLLLSEELPSLPQLMRELAEEVQSLSAEVRALAEAQRRTEERVEALVEAQRRTEERVEALAEAQRRTEERLARLEATVEALAEAQRRTEEQLARLTGEVQRIDSNVGALRGQVLALSFRDRAYAYFGRHVRRLRVLSPQEVAWLLEDAVEAGRLTEAERERVALVDVVAVGQDRETGDEVYLVVEVSVTVDTSDVIRAVERAALLGKAVGRVVPVVAGERLTERAAYEAKAQGVVRVLDGHVEWP